MLGIGLRSNMAACTQLMDHDLLGTRRFAVVSRRTAQCTACMHNMQLWSLNCWAHAALQWWVGCLAGGGCSCLVLQSAPRQMHTPNA